MGVLLDSVIELAHGIERANPERGATRQRFLEELLEEIAIEPVSIAIALRAGRIDGELAAKGMRVALGDLLIGATALHLGFELVTDNARHFKMIPNLAVRRL